MAILATERLLQLDGGEGTGRDLGVLLFHDGKIKEALEHLEAFELWREGGGGGGALVSGVLSAGGTDAVLAAELQVREDEALAKLMLDTRRMALRRRWSLRGDKIRRRRSIRLDSVVLSIGQTSSIPSTSMPPTVLYPYSQRRTSRTRRVIRRSARHRRRPERCERIPSSCGAQRLDPPAPAAGLSNAAAVSTRSRSSHSDSFRPFTSPPASRLASRSRCCIGCVLGPPGAAPGLTTLAPIGRAAAAVDSCPSPQYDREYHPLLPHASATSGVLQHALDRPGRARSLRG